MIIPKIIFYINVSFWLLPPFRQKGCKYFLYFLILALSDPIVMIINWFRPLESSVYYLVVSTFILIVLLKKKYLLLTLILILFAAIYLSNPEIRMFTFLVHFIILLYFLREFIMIISKDSGILIFNLMLVLYEASIIFKFAASYLSIAGYLYFYLTTAFEIFIALFFAIFNEKNSPFIKLQMEPREIE